MSRNRPIQTDAQNLGDIGESMVQLVLRKFKWTADIIKSDFGEDIDCNIFIDNIRTNYHLRCQVKSTKKDSDYVKELQNGDYSVSISSGLLKAWLTSYFPVFLIIYEEDSDLCYWTVPTKQIIENPSKLEKKNPTIRVSKENIFNQYSKETILEEVRRFYHKILRLDEATISCDVTPVLMPNYRIIPFHDFSDFIYDSDTLKSKVSGNYIELLPSWMAVLKRLDPSYILPSIKVSSENANLSEFLEDLRKKLNGFKYQIKENEWIAFIVSPLKIVSEKSSWVNELTYWTSYSKIDNLYLVSDYDYNFKFPLGFLSQVSRRARSWDYYHQVNPAKDIAVQFFGCCEITPSILNINKVHQRNIDGQMILWECNKDDLDKITEIIHTNDLSLQLINEKNETFLIAITTVMFDPFMGIYSVAMDWDSFENGNVRNKLEENKLLDTIPGNEFKGEIPEFLSKAMNRFNNKKFSKTTITELESIPGFPLIHNDRSIEVSRFQMVTLEKAKEIDVILNEIVPINKKNFQIYFDQIDSRWSIPIYELTISWSPELSNSSREDYEEIEDDLLLIFNKVLPSSNTDLLQFKNTFDILHIAGEIGFEKTLED